MLFFPSFLPTRYIHAYVHGENDTSLSRSAWLGKGAGCSSRINQLINELYILHVCLIGIYTILVDENDERKVNESGEALYWISTGIEEWTGWLRLREKEKLDAK